MLGAILVSQNQINVVNALDQERGPQRGGALRGQLARRPYQRRRPGGGPPGAGPVTRAAVHDVQLAYAHSTQTVFYIMAGVMAATFLVALRRLPPGRVDTQEITETPAEAEAASA